MVKQQYICVCINGFIMRAVVLLQFTNNMLSDKVCHFAGFYSTTTTETLVPQQRSSLHSDSSLAVSAAEHPDRRPRPRRRGPGSDLEPLGLKSLLPGAGWLRIGGTGGVYFRMEIDDLSTITKLPSFIIEHPFSGARVQHIQVGRKHRFSQLAPCTPPAPCGRGAISGQKQYPLGTN